MKQSGDAVKGAGPSTPSSFRPFFGKRWSFDLPDRFTRRLKEIRKGTGWKPKNGWNPLNWGWTGWLSTLAGGCLAIFGGMKGWPAVRQGMEKVSAGIGRFLQRLKPEVKPAETLKPKTPKSSLKETEQEILSTLHTDQSSTRMFSQEGGNIHTSRSSVADTGVENTVFSENENQFAQGINSLEDELLPNQTTEIHREHDNHWFQDKGLENGWDDEINSYQWDRRRNISEKNGRRTFGRFDDNQLFFEDISESIQEIKPYEIEPYIVEEIKPKTDYTNPETIRHLERDEIFQTNGNQFIGQGRDACAYSIPDHPDLVLRIESYRGNIPTWYNLHEEIIPVDYQNRRLTERNNLGLPVAVALSKEHHLLERMRREGRTGLKPAELAEASGNRDICQILQRMDGEHLNDAYKENFLRLCHPDKIQAMFERLSLQEVLEGNVPNLGVSEKNKQKGNQITCLVNEIQHGFGNKTRQAGAQSVPITQQDRHQFLEERLASKRPVDKAFIRNYEEFVKKYKDNLQDIAALDQAVFDEAAESLKALHDAGVGVDMTHPRNTFIDYEKDKFNFIDFDFSDNQTHPPLSRILDDFYSVILGRYNDSANYVDAEPLMYIVRDGDRNALKKPIQAIQHKLRAATRRYCPGWEPPKSEYLFV